MVLERWLASGIRANVVNMLYDNVTLAGYIC